MLARFERLSMADHLYLVGMLSLVAVLTFPATADAAVANKTDSALEIKNFETIKASDEVMIPGPDQIYKFLTGNFSDTEKKEPAPTPAIQTTPDPAVTTSVVVIPNPPAPQPVAKTSAPAVKKIAYTIPPKAQNKVYMHEPEIRDYICPKLGDQCNTFIAVLKAENGTHECTRDNRGTNKNGSIDIGLAQINWSPSSPYSFEQLQDCKFNLDIAMKKYEARGFRPWYAYTTGKYKKHLAAVTASAVEWEESRKIQ